MVKLLSNVPPFQFVSIGKNGTETFSRHIYQSIAAYHTVTFEYYIDYFFYFFCFFLLAWIFSLAMAQNKYTERELGKFDPFRKLSIVWRT